MRKGAPIADFDAIFFPSCTATLFGTSDSTGALITLAKRAGIKLSIPTGIESLAVAPRGNLKVIPKAMK